MEIVGRLQVLPWFSSPLKPSQSSKRLLYWYRYWRQHQTFLMVLQCLVTDWKLLANNLLWKLYSVLKKCTFKGVMFHKCVERVKYHIMKFQRLFFLQMHLWTLHFHQFFSSFRIFEHYSKIVQEALTNDQKWRFLFPLEFIQSKLHRIANDLETDSVHAPYDQTAILLLCAFSPGSWIWRQQVPGSWMVPPDESNMSGSGSSVRDGQKGGGVGSGGRKIESNRGQRTIPEQNLKGKSSGQKH